MFRETRFAETACFAKQRNRRNDPFCFAKQRNAFRETFRETISSKTLGNTSSESEADSNDYICSGDEDNIKESNVTSPQEEEEGKEREQDQKEESA